MQSLKIAHVTSYQVPDYGYEELALAQAQAALGHQVCILTSNYLHPRGLYDILKQRFPQRQVAPRLEQQDGVRIARLPAFELASRTWIRGLERRLAAFRPDIVHTHNLLQFHPVRLALYKARAPWRFGLVVDDHMHRIFMRKTVSGRLFYALYRTLVQPLVTSQIDAFAGISPDTIRYLTEACGVQRPIQLRPLGVDTNLFSHAPAGRQRLRAQLSFSEQDVVFLYTGKVIAAKRLDLLVEAAGALRSDGHPVQVLIVGDADTAYQDSLCALAAGVSTGSWLHFIPSVAQHDLPDYYACADVAVWPSQESKAVLEALSCSLPVIVNREVENARLLASGGGLTFEAESSRGLADAMTELLPAPRRQEMGAAGRRLVVQEYSWLRSAERYLETYRTVLAA